MENFQYFRNLFSLTQEELTKKLSLGKNAVSLYESDKSSPSFKVLKKLIDIYQVSFDYFFLKDSCQYPKDLKFLKLAKQLDNPKFSDGRNNIENSARSLLGNQFNSDLIIKQDFIEIELQDDFHKNLKEIRNLKKMTQLEIGKKIDVSRNVMAQYELTNYPSHDKLIVISSIFDISIHALVTGQKLSFEFKDQLFGQTMLLADHFLNLDDHKVLIRLMESSLNSKNLISA
jgi:transcriptional regulator with XRE-family HTH domain